MSDIPFVPLMTIVSEQPQAGIFQIGKGVHDLHQVALSLLLCRQFNPKCDEASPFLSSNKMMYQLSSDFGTIRKTVRHL